MSATGRGTPVQELLDAHVRANRPIGGSSAGLAVLGHYCYSAFDGGSMESKVALADPFDSGVTLERDFLHYRWLEDVITDTHFSARKRLGRLIAFVARLNDSAAAGGGDPGRIYGVGVDEHTALLVDADGIGRLAPGSAGSAWFVMATRRPSVLAAGKPLSLEAIRLTRVGLEKARSISARARQPARRPKRAFRCTKASSRRLRSPRRSCCAKKPRPAKADASGKAELPGPCAAPGSAAAAPASVCAPAFGALHHFVAQ